MYWLTIQAENSPHQFDTHPPDACAVPLEDEAVSSAAVPAPICCSALRQPGL